LRSQAQDALEIFVEEGCPDVFGKITFVAGYTHQKGLFVRSPLCLQSYNNYCVNDSMCCEACMRILLAGATITNLTHWAHKLHKLRYVEARINDDEPAKYLEEWKKADFVKRGAGWMLADLGYSSTLSTIELCEQVAFARELLRELSFT